MPPDRAVVVAIDQGTSSTKALAVAGDGRVVGRGSAPLAIHAPRPGWVEHAADDVIASAVSAVADLARSTDLVGVREVGISNQRESVVLWDRATGAAVSPVLSWQDRRTTDLCGRLAATGISDDVRRISGLPLDPMFSAVKVAWLLDAYDPDRTRSAAGELCVGTVDSWLAWHLTGQHVIEAGNASRTSLVDLGTGHWSPDLLAAFDVPIAVLPRVTSSTHDHGPIRALTTLPAGVRLTGILGDSHAALFAHRGWQPGIAKATFGTGSSVMAAVGSHGADRADGAGAAGSGLCRTIAWHLAGQSPTLAVEANILSSGATLAWLAGILGTTPAELAGRAAPDSGEVYFVPAFNGLGAPWWDSSARALMVGMSLGTTPEHLARAALDSMVLQVGDVIDAMRTAGIRPARMVVDGQVTSGIPLMRRLADVIDLPVLVSDVPELSALGAAWAAGLGAGRWSLADLETMPRTYDDVLPGRSGIDAAALRLGWQDAMARSRALAPGTTRQEEQHG